MKAFSFLFFSFLGSIVFANNPLESHASHEEVSVLPLVFVITSILIGAFIRFAFKNIKFPFTVILLIVGVILGLFTRIQSIGSISFMHLNVFFDSVAWASDIDPHLLLFIFLPILIFEAAFAMDLHTFKKTSVNSTLLAVPGVLINLFTTAFMLMAIQYLGYGLHEWTWILTLMFSAIISATDPVAVVAILKELGVSKRLTTLIEGESLLNDGTALVIFMVFLGTITAQQSQNHELVEFLRVSLGGVAVGLIIGILFIRWIKRIFNDAMVEISIVIAAAYLTFYLAEHIFHVSGVLSLVALGISLGGYGRSFISPKVQHFMKEFWELAGFIANTMIFLIVGIVITMKTTFNIQHFIILIFIYLIIHFSRAISIISLFPLMRRSGYGVSQKEAMVLWYGGGLRGALGLSLGLIVLGVDEKYISVEIKDEIFFYISGIVILTLLINATTSELMIKKLGLTKLSGIKKWMIQQSKEFKNQQLHHFLEELKSKRYIKGFDEASVKTYIPNDYEKVSIEQVEISQRIAEIRIRLLEKEKSSYWHQYKEGLLMPNSLNKLLDSINVIIDEEGNVPLSERKDMEIVWKPSRVFKKLSTFTLIKSKIDNYLFKNLYYSYDAVVSFVISQEECLSLLEEMNHNKTVEAHDYEMIKTEIQNNIIEGNTFLRNMKINYSEIFQKITTLQATFLTLKKEEEIVLDMQEKGLLQEGESEKMLVDIETRLKKLNF